MFSSVKRPSASVTVACSTARLTVKSETSAPLKIAPSGSLTVPLILPLDIWPEATTHTRMVNKNAVRTFIRSVKFSVLLKLLPVVVINHSCFICVIRGLTQNDYDMLDEVVNGGKHLRAAFDSDTKDDDEGEN